MHLLTRALAAATLLGAIATTVAAQTTPAPAPAATSTHPDTKVYAYKETAPKGTSPSSSASPSQMAHDPDMPPYGSQKWWEEKNRWGQGEGGGN